MLTALLTYLLMLKPLFLYKDNSGRLIHFMTLHNRSTVTPSGEHAQQIHKKGLCEGCVAVSGAWRFRPAKLLQTRSKINPTHGIAWPDIFPKICNEHVFVGGAIYLIIFTRRPTFRFIKFIYMHGSLNYIVELCANLVMIHRG